MKHKIWIILAMLLSGTLNANEAGGTLQQERQQLSDKRKEFEELLLKKKLLKSRQEGLKSNEQQVKQDQMKKHLYPRGTIATH